MRMLQMLYMRRRLPSLHFHHTAICSVSMALECLVFAFSLAAGYSQGQSIISAPDNATGNIRGIVQFSCAVIPGTIHTVTWEFNDNIVYSFLDGQEDYPEGHDKYSVTQDETIFTLIVKDLKLEDGGCYSCSTMTEKKTGNLVVLGTPEIVSHVSSPTEDTVALYTCKAPFSGPSKMGISPNHYPHLRMMLDGEPLEEKVIEEQHERQITYYVLSELHSVMLKPWMNSKLLECEISTSEPRMTVTGSAEINVLYPVKNIGYSPIKAFYKVEAVINCTSDGNPQPSFQWENIGSGRTFQGHWLIITNEMTGKNSWKCTATNTVNGKKQQATVFAEFVAVNPANSAAIMPVRYNNMWYNAVTTTIPTCAVVIVATVVLILIQRRQYQKAHQKEANSEEGETPLLPEQADCCSTTDVSEKDLKMKHGRLKLK